MATPSTALPIDLVVFDIAGTTVDDGQQVYRVLEETVVAHGGTPTSADIDRWHGANKHHALRALLSPADAPMSDAELEPIVADFQARLIQSYVENPPVPLPGVPEALAELRDTGIRVALSTGFDSVILSSLIPAVGWDDSSLIETVVGGSDVPAGRPAPYLIFEAMKRLGVTDVRRVMVAGDTPRDLEAGMNSGAGFVIGVLSGASTEEELAAHPHTHIVASVADVPALLGLRDSAAA